MPSLYVICQRCGQEYGDHCGNACPSGNTKFLAQNDLPSMDDICGNCGETWGLHYGPHKQIETYCREKDWARINLGKIEKLKVSKYLQFSYKRTPRMFDKNQTYTAVGDTVTFDIHGAKAFGVVCGIEEQAVGYDNKPVFVIKYKDSNYERFRSDVESTCEDFSL